MRRERERERERGREGGRGGIYIYKETPISHIKLMKQSFR